MKNLLAALTLLLPYVDENKKCEANYSAELEFSLCEDFAGVPVELEPKLKALGYAVCFFTAESSGILFPSDLYGSH